MATENESTLHKSGTQDSKESLRRKKTSLYDVLPSLNVTEEQTGRRKTDEYLKLFQHLINQSNDAIFIIDPESAYFIDVNDKACTSLEYSYKELLSMSVMDIQQAFPDIESWRKHVEIVRNDGCMMREGVHKRKNGSVFPVEVSVKHVTHDRINYIIAFSRDISIRKKAQEDLDKYKLLFSQINDLAYICDADGNLTYANDVFEKLTGFKVSDYIGKSFAPLFDDYNLEKAMIEFGKTLNGECTQFELYFKNTGIPCEYNNMPLKDDKQNIIGVVGIARDITERKQAEIALKESEARFKTLTSLAPVGIYLADPEGNCLYVNNAWSEMSGLSLDDAKGKGWIKGIHPQDRGQVMSMWEKMVSSGGNWGHEYRFRHSEGKITWVLGYAKKILNDAGEVSGYVGTNLDITSRKQNEKRALRANQLASIGELAAGVAHEINNPINGIINYAQILENRNDQSSKEWDIACRIIKEGNRIADIVSCLLSFSREIKEEKIPVRVDVLLAMALELVDSQLQKDGIILKLNIPQDMSMVSVQQQQIRQVFLNMISNARYALNRKYAGVSNKKVLKITCEEVLENDAPFIRVIFHDNGTGIPETEVDKIMNPFFSTKPCEHGTGLGLSISDSIISDHGGKINISSEEGMYTEVVVSLPVIERSSPL